MRTGSEAAERLGQLAVRALLREVAASPKPGLVDRFGSGSHEDMDFMTFADSALTLGPTFAACAREGLDRGRAMPSWANVADATEYKTDDLTVRANDAAFLAVLRCIGMEGEARMFAASGGINTHKGALFLLGLQVAAAGALMGAGQVATADRTRQLAARLARDMAIRELPSASTHGADAFRIHGSRGIRGEVESGLASLDAGALSFLRRSVRLGRMDDSSCVDALLMLMAVTDDTTVLHRGGPEALAFVRRSAILALALGACRTAAGREEIERMGRKFESRRLSPGGSADLLSAGIFLVEMELEFAKPTAYSVS